MPYCTPELEKNILQIITHRLVQRTGQSHKEAQKHKKGKDTYGTLHMFPVSLRRLCFSMRQPRFTVLQAESGGWTMKMRIDQFENFCWMKRFRERADRAEFFCFGEHLRTAVRSDQKESYLRLHSQQIRDDLKS